MSTLGTIILLTAALCSLGIPAFAQTHPGPQIVSVTRPGKIATYYNADKNSTTVVLGFSDVGGESPCGLYISANADPLPVFLRPRLEFPPASVFDVLI